MRRIRGIKDIHTHGSLSREGRLKSVVRDWHSPSVQRNNNDAGSNCNVEHLMVNPVRELARRIEPCARVSTANRRSFSNGVKPGTPKRTANLPHLDEDTVVASQIQVLRYTLEELGKAAHEKLE